MFGNCIPALPKKRASPMPVMLFTIASQNRLRIRQATILATCRKSLVEEFGRINATLCWKFTDANEIRSLDHCERP